MQIDFETIMEAVYRAEGGYVNDPRDPGGMTNLGVTARTWAAWRRVPLSTVTQAEMEALTEADTNPLYKAMYWNLIDGDSLPAGLDAMVMHFEINAGGAAAKELQAIVGVTQDGVIGTQTLGAITLYLQAVSLRQLIDALALAQLTYYQTLAGWAVYGKGWSSRVHAFQALAYQLGGILELPLPQQPSA